MKLNLQTNNYKPIRNVYNDIMDLFITQSVQIAKWYAASKNENTSFAFTFFCSWTTNFESLDDWVTVFLEMKIEKSFLFTKRILYLSDSFKLLEHSLYFCSPFAYRKINLRLQIVWDV